MTHEELINKAIEARKYSYSPYSHFSVGAAVLSKSGQVYIGANIENSSYPLCMCAERNALYSAYLAGETKDTLVMLAVVADTPEACSPCGACRQVMSELLNKDTPILMANLHGVIKESTPSELLPFAFSGDDMQ